MTTLETVDHPVRAFFAAPASRIMPLDTVATCPAFPGLSLQAIAAAPRQRHYLVISLRRPGTAPVLAHLGPDAETVARHGLLLVAALRARGDIAADLIDGATVLTWLADCWNVALAEITRANRS